MSAKVTRKYVANTCENCVAVPYNDMQTLLRYCEPMYHTEGVYGWNCDVYLFNGLTITTGYRGMVGERAKNVVEFEKLARKVSQDSNLTWQQQEEKINELLCEFIVLNGGRGI